MPNLINKSDKWRLNEFAPVLEPQQLSNANEDLYSFCVPYKTKSANIKLHPSKLLCCLTCAHFCVKPQFFTSYKYICWFPKDSVIDNPRCSICKNYIPHKDFYDEEEQK